jgi:hypothetical protein
MNTIFKITLALTLLFINVGHVNAQVFGNKKITGNNNVVTKTVNTSDYDAISVTGSMDVELVNGNEGIIKVTTDENLHEYLVIESKDGTLKIKTKKNFSLKTKKGIHITVPFKVINDLALIGSGDIVTKSSIKTSRFDVELTGSGDIILDIEADDIDARVTGSGDLKMAGKVTDFEVKVTGSGDFKGSELSSTNTQVYVSGSGSAKVNASSSIKARVNGSGDIRYSGNPELNDTKVMGSGTIKSN